MKVYFRSERVLELNNKSVFAVSHSDRPIPKPLQSVMELLEKLNCEFLTPRWSHSDVPHIVLQFRTQTYSVCYFGRDKVYRVFFPYGGSCTQRHYDCKTPQEVVDFVQLEGVARCT